MWDICMLRRTLVTIRTCNVCYLPFDTLVNFSKKNQFVHQLLHFLHYVADINGFKEL